MKFKKDPTDEPARILKLVDFDEAVLEVSVYDDPKARIVVSIKDGEHFSCVGIKRKKALKLAWAIIDELNPSMLA